MLAHKDNFYSATALNGALFVFALSFSLFAIQSTDVLMYLSLARDYFSQGGWSPSDPYIYSLPQAELRVAHEYLSYFVFYGAWLALGFAGLIGLKILVLASQFFFVLWQAPRSANLSPLWITCWMLAVGAASFRFVERTSMFSDLFCIVLMGWLLETSKLTRGFILRLVLLFLVWVQLHPGYPLGLLILALWAAWHWWQTPHFRNLQVLWLIPVVLTLLCNPLRLDGALYPFRFALNEAATLKLHNMEWLPSYHQVYRTAPEVLAFWLLSAISLAQLWWGPGRSLTSLRGAFALFAVACGTAAIRFVPWTSFALLMLIKPSCAMSAVTKTSVRSHLGHVLTLLLLVIAIKNFAVGYTGSCGLRVPSLALDSRYYPLQTAEFLRANPPRGRLYNVHEFGSFLIWQKILPIFHHGFVTDMDFYSRDVAGVFQSQERFLELAKKYNWTALLIDTQRNLPYFHAILSPLTEWKIVARDEASMLLYKDP